MLTRKRKSIPDFCNLYCSASCFRLSTRCKNSSAFSSSFFLHTIVLPGFKISMQYFTLYYKEKKYIFAYLYIFILKLKYIQKIQIYQYFQLLSHSCTRKGNKIFQPSDLLIYIFNQTTSVQLSLKIQILALPTYKSGLI